MTITQMTTLSQTDQVLIIPKLAAAGKKEVLDELVAAAGQVFDPTLAPGLDPELVTAHLEAREELGSTGIGDGMAIPHGRIEGLRETILVCGRSSKGIPFDADDGRPVHIFLLLLTPTSADCPYLSYLAELVLFLRNPLIRSRLLQAESRAELAAILREKTAGREAHG